MEGVMKAFIGHSVINATDKKGRYAATLHSKIVVSEDFTFNVSS